MMTIDNSKTVNLEPLKIKMTNLKAEIVGFRFDDEQHLATKGMIDNLLGDPAAFVGAMNDGNMEREFAIHALYGKRTELANYEATLGMDLMQCNSKFLITDTPNPQSPAGFSPESNVFVQTTIAVHVDNLRQIPQSNVKLYAHKMHRA